MKKKIPLIVRQALEEMASELGENFIVEFEEGSVVTFLDRDIDSNFYFELKKISNKGQHTQYETTYRPSSDEHLDGRSVSLTTSNFKQHFTIWKDLVNAMSEPSILFDDVFTKKYYDELEPEFQIIDEDSEYAPFSLNQQERIIAFLDYVDEFAKSLQDSQEKSDILSLSEKTNASISRLTKSQVIKNIRQIVAKGYKIGRDVGQKLLIDFTTELVKKLLQGN